MVDRNTLVYTDLSPQATDPKSDMTLNFRPPQTLKCEIQEINEDNCQTHKINFQNCGTVNLNIDSFNARGVKMRNCGNKVPQVTICSSLFPSLSLSHFFLM